jgi:hypothetical protein
MKNIHRRAFRPVARVAVVLLAMGIASAPLIFAGSKPKKSVDQKLGVIAHVQLDGRTATRMLLVQKNEKRYLYVGFGSSSDVCIFEVTTPAAPRKLERLTETDDSQTADFQLVGETLAVTSRTGEATKGSSDVAPHSVTILNMTDPANPQPVQTFSGVTNVVADDVHGLIYLSNDEGLWVVQAKQAQKAEADNKYLNADVGP